MQHTATAAGSSTDSGAGYHHGRHLTTTSIETPEARSADLLDLIAHGRPAWHRQAACNGAGPARFFADDRKTEGQALCQTCPVSVECRDAGIGEYGVWGGVDRDQVTRAPHIEDRLTETILSTVDQHPFEFSPTQLAKRVKGAAKQRIRRTIGQLVNEGRLVSLPMETTSRAERVRHGRRQSFSLVQTYYKLGPAR